MDLAVNLFGEEEPYGPVEKPKAHAMNQPGVIADGKANNRWTNRHNTHEGAPPLDWWVIDDGP